MPNTISPNMGLIVPGVGTEPGPTWATDLNSDLGILDQHNHSAGQGVPITPSGLDINSDLSIQSNNLTFVKTVRFASQLAPISGVAPNLGIVYVAGNELYYNDEVGNVVPITNAGSVNAGAGSITGLPSGTASASYNSGTGTFIWQSSTNTAANMDNASVTIREQASMAKGVTLSSPNSLAADYTLSFPAALPGSTKILTVDTSGNIGDVYDVDNVTLDVSANLLEVKDLGITLAKLAADVTAFLVPSGSMLAYGGASSPTGYLLCDGTSYLRATYPNLFTAIGTAYGAADGTHFNVPDLRGRFQRGVSNGSGNDPDAASRTASNAGGNTGDNVGSLQADAFSAHSHYYPSAQLNSGGGSSVFSPSVVTDLNGTSTLTGTADSANTGGNETRPRNVYVNYIIKT